MHTFRTTNLQFYPRPSIQQNLISLLLFPSIATNGLPIRLLETRHTKLPTGRHCKINFPASGQLSGIQKQTNKRNGQADEPISGASRENNWLDCFMKVAPLEEARGSDRWTVESLIDSFLPMVSVLYECDCDLYIADTTKGYQ